MDQIQTASGKTAKANIAALRQRRQALPVDKTEALIAHMEAVATAGYALIATLRPQINRLRNASVAAMQLASEMRSRRKPDIEI